MARPRTEALARMDREQKALALFIAAARLRERRDNLARPSFESYIRDIVIEDATGGGNLVPFIPWDHLLGLAQRWARGESMVILKSRQIGVSWLEAAFACWTAFQPNSRVLILSQGEREAWELLRKVRFVNEHHRSYQRKYVTANKSELVMEDGGTILALPSTHDAGRGFTATLVIVDEAAGHPYAEENYQAYRPTVADGGQLLVSATAKGPSGWFYRTYMEAKRGASNFSAVFLPVTVRPDRDEQWLQAERKNWPEDVFKQEYPLCLTGEMRVSTEQGMIRIDQAKGARRTESGPIDRWCVQPASTIYRLETEGGRVLRGTKDHPVMTGRGLVGLGYLLHGDEVVLRSPMFAEREWTQEWFPFPGVKHSVHVDEDWGRFMGYFMGDGSWYAGQISFICDAKDEDVIADVTGLLTRLIGEPQHREIARVKGRKGAVEVRLSRKESFDAFSNLGLITDETGTWRRKVSVPEPIWRSPKHVVREFLRGLFESDGSVAKDGKVRWASSKLSFAREVQLLLLAFGINATIGENRKQAQVGKYFYTSYTLEMTMFDSRKFLAEIGFVGSRKQLRATAPSSSGRPTTKREFKDSVRCVSEDGYEETYDFALATDDHLFQAQGIVTHNTDDEAFVASAGLVFPMFSADRHTRPGNPVPLADCFLRVAGIDPGGDDPSVISVLGAWKRKDSGEVRFHKYAEHYSRKMLSVDEMVQYLYAFQTPFNAVFVDSPSKGPLIAQLRLYGVNAFGANKDRGAGLAIYKRMLEEDRLTINAACKEGIDEHYSYWWDPKSATKFATVTGEGHHADGIDSTRYALVGGLEMIRNSFAAETPALRYAKRT